MSTPRPRTQERRRRSRKPLAKDSAAARVADLRLARLHLMTGILPLARAEFESLVGSGPLGAPALADLAEVRWRTGDLPGAGDAAAAHLEAGGGEGRALAIAAEAAAAIGRTVEAERLAIRAVERLDQPPIAFFAGISMSDVWPAEVRGPSPAASVAPSASSVAPKTTNASDDLVGLAQPARPTAVREPRADGTLDLSAELAPEPGVEPGVEPPVEHVAEPGVEPEAALGSWPVAEPGAEPATARPVDVDSGLPADVAALALRRVIALRLDPGLASNVIEETESMSDPASMLLRGDALRLVGREEEAQAAFAAANDALDEPPGGPAGPGAVR